MRTGVAALVVLSLVPPAQPLAQAQAAGSPIFDCAGMQATSARLQAGLPVQDQWIRSTEEQLAAARAGSRESREALWALAVKTLTSAAARQLSLARELGDRINLAQGYSSIARQRWHDRVNTLKESAEALEKAASSAKAGTDLGPLIAQNRLTLREFIKQIGESSISDELGIQAATFAGPAGVAVVETFLVTRDLSFALAEGKMNADEVRAAERNLSAMREARAEVQRRVYELGGILASPSCAATPAGAAAPASPPGPTPTAAPVPAAPRPPASAPAPSAKKGGGAGTVLLLGLAAVGGAGYYAYTKSQNCGEGDTGQIYAACKGGTPAACRTAEANQEAYCKCKGYSGQYGGNCVK